MHQRYKTRRSVLVMPVRIGAVAVAGVEVTMITDIIMKTMVVEWCHNKAGEAMRTVGTTTRGVHLKVGSRNNSADAVPVRISSPLEIFSGWPTEVFR